MKGEKFSRSFNIEMQKTAKRDNSIRFTYETEKAGDVRLSILNPDGKTVVAIVNRHQASGRHVAEIDRLMAERNNVRGRHIACLSANGRRISREVYL